MRVYLITLEEKNEQAWERIREAWPKRHRLVTDTMAFVAPEGISVAEDVSDAIGMNAEEDVGGFVVPLESCAGRSFDSTLKRLENAQAAR